MLAKSGIVNMHEAKTNLSRLVARVAAGEEIIIGRAGVPVAKLVPYDGAERVPQRIGYWEGRIWMADDWNSEETNEEIAQSFYESEIEPPEDRS